MLSSQTAVLVEEVLSGAAAAVFSTLGDLPHGSADRTHLHSVVQNQQS